ncbi:hypothetical protein XA68_10946 [Ophiocordyceps unilateralis]|uniref:ATPase synthesis protein 25 n=1 Tax=Ophiocordyceps unilateralis TaxID=268505 RepID=A0A2A9PHP3_OPHUN|nr:hypothetical protein XA68_10946 [Ophiocordyceps unilateralis]
MAALRCCACRSAVLGAVLGRAAPTAHIFPRSYSPAAVRTLSTSQQPRSDEHDSRDLVNGDSGKLLVDEISGKATMEKIEKAPREAPPMAHENKKASSEGNRASAFKREPTAEETKATPENDQANSKPCFLGVEPPRRSDERDSRNIINSDSDKLPMDETSRKAPMEKIGKASLESPQEDEEASFEDKEASASESEATAEDTEATAENDQANSKPWFLEVEPPSKAWKPHEASLPKPPADAPSLLAPMIQYVYEDMGLDDLALLDLRDLDPSPSLGPSLMMVIATARSGRHLHVSAGRFVRWLRRNYGVRAKGDGLIGSALLRTKLRRLRKKAKLMGTNSMVVPQGDYGLTTDWVCVTFSTGNGAMAEVEHYDQSGRLSGFGRAHSGTTVAVQCLTEQRRNELDLESLWQEQLRSSIKRSRRIQGEASNAAEIETVVSTKLQLPRPTFSSAFQTRWQDPSQQQRAFSTAARRLQANEESQTAQPTSGQDVPADGLAALRRRVLDVQLKALPLDAATLNDLLAGVLLISSPRADTESERLALVDGLLLTGQERGLIIDSRDMLVALIASLVLSPAYGQKLAQAQSNLEAVLLDKQSTPQEEHTLRLMDAYARRGLWARFSEAFRTPARFQLPRSPIVYELAFRSLAATQNSVLCKDCLRWMYPDMLREVPPVAPMGLLFDRLKECILLADPSVEEERQAFTPETEMGARKALRSEFKVMLNDVCEKHVNATLV